MWTLYSDELLQDAREYRCCKEILECIDKFTFEDKDQGRQSIPKSGGNGLQTRKVRRYATRHFFLNFGTLKRHSQRFGGTYKVILQCA